MIVEEQENSLRELADQDSDDALIRNLQQLEVNIPQPRSGEFFSLKSRLAIP